MKTRNGFVSNSSSSSFIIFFRELTYDEFGKLVQEDLDNMQIYVIGKHLSAGFDYFNVDSMEMFNQVLAYGETPNHELDSYHDTTIRYLLVYIQRNTEDETSIEFKSADLPEVFKLMSIDVDYHKTTSADQFYSRYNYTD